MKVAIYVNNARHQREHAAAMREGMARHGIRVELHPAALPTTADFHVVWGWKRPRIIAAAKATGSPILVMERGHLPDRMAWTSCGWDGLGARGRYPTVEDGGERFRRHWGHLMQPWRPTPDGHVLLLGQVPGDAALYGLRGDFNDWSQRISNDLHAAGWGHIVFRPHPLTVKTNAVRTPNGAVRSENSHLADDLGGAAFAVGYNSTALVETVMAGIPSVAMDPVGAMAGSVCMHEIPRRGETLACPDRERWASWLAWCQWSMDEIRSGECWEVVQCGA